jgi:hypothetical protein
MPLFGARREVLDRSQFRIPQLILIFHLLPGVSPVPLAPLFRPNGLRGRRRSAGVVRCCQEMGDVGPNRRHRRVRHLRHPHRRRCGQHGLRHFDNDRLLISTQLRHSVPVRLGGPLLVGALAAGACAVIWVGDPTTPGGFLPVSPTKALLGIDCPGCGTLRMIYSLLHADFLSAVRFNALAVVAAAFLFIAYVVWTYGRVVGRKISGWQHHRWAATVTMALVTTWFVVRNLPFEPFTALRV